MNQRTLPQMMRRIHVLLIGVLCASLISTAPIAPATAADTTGTLSGTIRVGPDARLAAEGEVQARLVSSDGTITYNQRSTTDAEGRFALTGLAVGTVYRVYFVYSGPEDIPAAYYSGPACGEQCPNVTVTAETNLDFTMPEGRGPRGTVRNESGEPLRGIEVTLEKRDADYPVWDHRQMMTTDAAGAYRFTAATEDGIYRIRFRDPLKVYATQAYPDGSPYLSTSELDLRDGAIPPVADAVLRRAGTIDGRIEFLGLAKPDDALTFALEIRHPDGGWRQTDQTVSATARTPRFVFEGLYPGVYRVIGWNENSWLRPFKVPTITVREGAVTSTTFRFKTQEVAPNRDFSGDGLPDVLAIAANGDLRLYTGKPSGVLNAGKVVGRGWSIYSTVFAVGDFSGDGLPDLLGRDRSGALWMHRGNGTGGWKGSRMKVGSGWQGFTALLGPGDFNGDGYNDVLARDAAGRLRLYPGNGAGGFKAASYVGQGWNGFTAILGSGDLQGTHPVGVDLLAVSRWAVPKASNPDMSLYPTNGVGGWMVKSIVGKGFSTYNLVVSGGDQLVLTRDSSGRLWRHEWVRDAFEPRQLIGTGWGSLSLVR
ncbi:FG-GAP-like repeat-containing protein [Agromyces sp. NPDC058126]|uniref:FG-GAP-like repeat-containing protein n=1 Tax=Agromyces sp. NPDC058126 TaxID=3346350 RepID=UPI0036D88752